MAYADMTVAELEDLAVTKKREELAYLESSKAERRAIRDEILRRANESYATQKLNALGITATPETLRAVMEAN